jgi:hypothetical protein
MGNEIRLGCVPKQSSFKRLRRRPCLLSWFLGIVTRVISIPLRLGNISWRTLLMSFRRTACAICCSPLDLAAVPWPGQRGHRLHDQCFQELLRHSQDLFCPSCQCDTEGLPRPGPCLHGSWAICTHQASTVECKHHR